MLSTAASNALLKTLEEPPAARGVRAGHHRPAEGAADHPQPHPALRGAPAVERRAGRRWPSSSSPTPSSTFRRGTVDHVVRAGGGSARDMESALDQVVAAGGAARRRRGARRAGRGPVRARHRPGARGGRRRHLGRARAPRAGRAADRSAARRVPGVDEGRPVPPARSRPGPGHRPGRRASAPAGATRALEVLGEAFVGIQDAPDQRIPLEVALVRLTRPDADTSLAALADRIARLERGAPAARLRRLRRRLHLLPLLLPRRRTPLRRRRPHRPVPARARSRSRRSGRRGRTAGAAGRSAVGRGTRGAAGQEEGAGRRGGRAGCSPPAAAAPATPPAPSPAPAAPACRAPARAGRARAGGVRGRGADPERTRRCGACACCARTRVGATPAARARRSGSGAAPAAAGGSGLPSRDELTLAWGDSILSSLPPRAKAFYAAGRFLEVVGLDGRVRAAERTAHAAVRERSGRCRGRAGRLLRSPGAAAPRGRRRLALRRRTGWRIEPRPP